MAEPRTRARPALRAAFVGLMGIGALLALAPGHPRSVKLERAPDHERATPPVQAPSLALQQDVAPAAAPDDALLARRPDTPEASPTLASAGQVAGPGPEDAYEPGMLPHPMNGARRRIDAENQLIQSLNDAMSFRRVDAMRDMLAAYRELDPSDVDAHQAGYAVIADCIESPGEGSLEAAHAFYTTERHSPLRRFVRRICFEHTN